MKTVDIEELLQWTYRDQMPKKDFQPWDVISAVGELMTQSDDGRPGVTRYAALYDGGPHPDALAVHDVVKRLDAINVRPTIEDPAALLSDMPDEVRAEAAPELQRYSVNLSLLVMAHGTKCSRPSWESEVPAKRPYTDSRTGKPIWYALREVEGVFDEKHLEEVIVGYDTKSKRVPRDAYQKFRFEPHVFLALSGRADYACWRASLVFLAEEFSAPGLLKEHVVTGPEAPCWPWEGETGRAPPRIIPSLVSAEDFSAARRPHKAPPKRWKLGKAVPAVEEA